MPHRTSPGAGAALRLPAARDLHARAVREAESAGLADAHAHSRHAGVSKADTSNAFRQGFHQPEARPGYVLDHALRYRAVVDRIGDVITPAGDRQVSVERDDRTDEDVFAVLGPTVDSVYVGKGRTGAKVALPSPVAMRIFLRSLVNARKGA